ncbi:hypothetical protein Tco_0550116, partial [Tanacetum coccineum]
GFTNKEEKEKELENILMPSQRDLSFMRHLFAKSLVKAKRSCTLFIT